MAIRTGTITQRLALVFLLLLRTLLFAGHCTLQAEAQEEPTFDLKLLLEDLLGTQVSLITLGHDSDLLYTQGGHTLLRLRHPSSSLDVAFNWGTFDPRRPYFLWHFYRGDLPYTLTLGPGGQAIAWERLHSHRGIVEDEWDLEPESKRILIQALSWWLDPTHRAYGYHIWGDNCATKVRDLLDLALGGELKRQFSRIPAPRWTYRTIWNRYFGQWSLTVSAADFLLNGEADQPLSLWEKACIPTALREQLLSFETSPRHPLTLRTLVHRSAPLTPEPPSFWPSSDPEALPGAWHNLISFQNILAVFWLFLTGFMWVKRSSNLQRVFFKFFGAASGLLGCIIFFAGLTTARTYFLWSWHTLLFWPVDGILWTKIKHRRVFWLAKAHLLASALYVTFGILGFNANLNPWILPVLAQGLGWFLLLWKHRIDPPPSQGAAAS